jgi:hypothetical protein
MNYVVMNMKGNLRVKYTTLIFDLFSGVDNPKNRQSYIVSTSPDNDMQSYFAPFLLHTEYACMKVLRLLN